MRWRLVASILVAGLLPFAAACWMADNYVSAQEHRAVETKVAYALRSASAQYADTLATTRSRARELASSRDVVQAMQSGDVRALRRLLGAREGVVLASGRQVGWKHGPVPVTQIEVRSRSKAIGTILVAAPAAKDLLPTISSRVGVPDETLAVSQGGRVLTGPPGLAVVAAGNARVRLNDHSYLEGSIGLPGYSPPVRVIALADEESADRSVAEFRRRLGLVGLAALASIFLYSIALARPLRRWFDQVAEVARQADVDPLTGVANRRGFELALETELLRSARYDRPCSLVLADLDDFKRVNDEHGHDVGDAILVAFTARLRQSVRASDVVARIGGEEFAVLLPELDLEGAVAAAERIRQSQEADWLLTRKGQDVRVTASFGVAVTTGATAPAELTRTADEALYAAKRGGKNRVVAADAAVPADEAGTRAGEGSGPGPAEHERRLLRR